MNEEIYYINLNEWDYNGHPNSDPFHDWMDDTKLDTYLRNEQFAKDNKICVRWFIIDMSVQFCITAPKSFVDKLCPCLWEEENKKFIKPASDFPDDEPPESWLYGEYGEYFLPYTDEYIGKVESRDWYQ